MQQGNRSLFAPGRRPDWHLVEPAIWSPTRDDSKADPMRSILRTLWDQPRWLEAHHLYDERGSELFERICELPEYYLTRTENAILEREAGEIIAAAPVECVVELGAGSAKKTIHLLQAQIARRRGGLFAPIDVSLTGLQASREFVQKNLPEIEFHGLHARYEDGFCSVDPGLPTLFVFLGSTVGNFNPSAFVDFFERLSAAMGPGDYLLLGADRVKDPQILEQAYDDSRGLTAKFILNAFENINRLTGSNFDVTKMRYHSGYNREWSRVEMYAVSSTAQEIRFPSFDVSFPWTNGSKILVEISRKFDPDLLQQQLRFFDFIPVRHFTDFNRWFSLLLFKKQS